MNVQLLLELETWIICFENTNSTAGNEAIASLITSCYSGFDHFVLETYYNQGSGLIHRRILCILMWWPPQSPDQQRLAAGPALRPPMSSRSWKTFPTVFWLRLFLQFISNLKV